MGSIEAKRKAEPAIVFGHYSDNNKSVEKVSRWTDADNFFKEKKYLQGFDAFFEYLRDDLEQNVVYERKGTEGRFEIYQGSKTVRGSFDSEWFHAEAIIAKMLQPEPAVMQRLLEMNFNFFYNRFALDSDRLCIRFDSDIIATSPTKLYFGLKELSTKADKQYYALTEEFKNLEKRPNALTEELPLNEREVKYEFLQKWINQTLEAIASVDADKFSGGISYMLLALIFRIDYLLSPEGTLLNELERVATIYFKKDERPAIEKNKDIINELKKIQAKPREEIFASMFRGKYTFSTVTPQYHKEISKDIQTSIDNRAWYVNNNYPFIASQVLEYGLSYCQFYYSLPRLLSDLINMYMRINYSDYFSALGFKDTFMNKTKKTLNKDTIIKKIDAIVTTWKSKYPGADFKTDNLKFDSLANFNESFIKQIQSLEI